jgi:polar amino acid transport system substrate-binding protein
VKLVYLWAALAAIVIEGAGLAAADDKTMTRELAPTGTLRVGVVASPAMSTFFVVKDADGKPRGVTVDLGAALARKLGVPVDYMVARNSGEVTDAVSSAAIDVAFMPVDDERKTKVDFGPAYYFGESTYLVRPGSDIRTLADVDRAQVRVIGIANTTTIRSATRALKSATIAPVASVGDAMAMVRDGQADAFALSKDSLRPLAATVPGARILDEAFHKLGIAIAVPKNRPAALAYASDFMEAAKASGSVRRALDRAGMQGEAVAPPGR